MNKSDSYQRLVFNKSMEQFNNSKLPFKVSIISILKHNFDIKPFLSFEFSSAYYAYYGSKRKFSLVSMINAFILKNVAGYSSLSKFINFLYMCKEAREFCGFYSDVPNILQFSRFKTSFASHIQELFMTLSIKSEHIFHDIDHNLASSLILDSSGILPYVKENNQRFLHSHLQRAKNSRKDNDHNVFPSFFSKLPKFADSQKDARFFYINGSFNYAFKFVLLTNGFGVPRFVQFIDKEFTSKHDSLNHCFSGNPLKDKAVHDSLLLEPVLNDFFKYLHFFNFHSFLADSAFDKVDHYNLLFDKFHFSKVFIPLNKRNSSSLDKDHISFEDDIPFCNKEALFFKYCGKSMGKGRSARLKFLCPLSKFQNGKYRCLCKNPCTSSSYGRTVYTYPKNYRDFPGLFRGSKEFTDTYKKRTVIEASISSLKTYIGLDDIKSRNSDSIKVDLLFACISKVVCAFVAYNSSRLPDLKSFNRLFKAS